MLKTIDTVLFDLDGTLTVPVIDFPALRKALGIPPGLSIIHALDALSPADRAAKEEIVLEAELDAARRALANRGAVELVDWLQGRGTRTAIITRNHPRPVDITLEILGLRFDVVIHRHSGVRVKPAPDPVHEALRRLDRAAATALMVGDWIDDITAGKAAGARTCFVTNGERTPPPDADMSVMHPQELLALFQGA